MQRLLVAPICTAVLVPFSMCIWIPAAHAGATATSGGGTISVGVSSGGSSPGSGGGKGSTNLSGSNGSGGGSGGSAPVCTDTVLTLNNDLGPPPGVTTPGSWYSITCTDASGNSTTETLWISSGSTPTTPSAPAIDPRTVALQAENSLQLPSPVPNSNPAGSAVVNLPTWLWIDPSLWHSYSVSATTGAVTATATAVPTSVTWHMGDGGSVTCNGPGTPYQAALPSSTQSTSCAYTYAVTSDGQPSPSGDPDGGAFGVTATVHWSVTWTAQGAAGGGSLPGLTTSTGVPLRVIQVESVNS